MLYFYKILGFLLRKMGPFFSREIFYLLLGLRPRPKLPRPWAGTVQEHLETKYLYLGPMPFVIKPILKMFSLILPNIPPISYRRWQVVLQFLHVAIDFFTNRSRIALQSPNA